MVIINIILGENFIPEATDDLDVYINEVIFKYLE